MNWIVLSALKEIYQNGRTIKKRTIASAPEIKFLINDTKELKEIGKEIVTGKGFKDYYERNHLSNYLAYDDFLISNNLKKPQTRFEESDIKILIAIQERLNTGELTDIRNQIIEAQETVRGVSLMFFKNEKYLETRSSLVTAVKQLLNIQELANEKDQQYKYVLECNSPRLIVLCENIDFLKRPDQPRKNNIELWYAGGKNIDKLNYADNRGIPIYYSCDWDYDGLKIFESVKHIIPQIELLYPTGEPKKIDATEHQSIWKYSEDIQMLSGLNKNLFNSKEKILIQNLIKNCEWIIEESNDLLKMINSN